jgi:uncharacterized protein
MKLASSFPVPASPDKVLSLFLDPATMRVCIPGCEELEQTDDTHYRGSLVNEVAHVKFKAGFVVDIVSTTTPSSTAEPAVVVAVLKGEDRRLGSTIKIDATLTVAPAVEVDGERSEVSYELEMAMWGKLGRLGEAVIRRRTLEVEKQFAEALTAVCSGQPVPVRAEKAKGRRGQAAAPVAPGSGTVHGAQAGAAAATPTTAAAPLATTQPEGRRTEDLVIVALVAAAAFAYGVIFGGRRGARR